jgi:3-hydroxyisobutyrate dehydrogenase-like beta-hydroxyacid dehydrogenase
MDIGFIGLGNMGLPMARRLLEAGHHLTVFDTRRGAIDRVVALGAQAAGSARDVADSVECIARRRSKVAPPIIAFTPRPGRVT